MVHLLKGIYPYVPVWAQNLGISLYGYAYRHERLGGCFSQHVTGFEERERWSEPVLARYVNQELRRILLRAFDQNDRPVPLGVEGRILTTGLLNDTQPLIRYDIGDVASLSPTPCTCGRSLPVLKNLVGRLEDVVICPDGREMVRFDGIFVGMPNVIEAQLIQDRIDLIRVRVVASERFGPADEELIKTRVAIERLGNVQVIVERVAKLDRTHGGKFRAVVSKVYPQELSVSKAGLRFGPEK